MKNSVLLASSTRHQLKSVIACVAAMLMVHVSLGQNGGAFRLLGPNGPNARLIRNTPTEVTWAGGNIQGRVNIALSLNGGLSYPITLASNVPVGQYKRTVVIPNVFSQQARIRITTNLTNVNDTVRVSTMSNPVPIESSGLCNYCVPSGSNATSFHILAVELLNTKGTRLYRWDATRDVVSTPYYDNYALDLSALNLVKGVSYQLRLTVSGSNSKSIAAWADYDQDCSFTSNTSEFLGSRVSTSNTIVRSFTVPSTAATGATGFRVKLFASSAAQSASLACAGTMSWGFGSSTNQGQTLNLKANITNSARLAFDEALETETAFNVYPNPTESGQVSTISVAGEEGEMMDVLVVDVTGRKVFSKSIVGTSNQEEISLNLPNGMYQVKVRSDSKSLSRKLVVR